MIITLNPYFIWKSHSRFQFLTDPESNSFIFEVLSMMKWSCLLRYALRNPVNMMNYIDTLKGMRFSGSVKAGEDKIFIPYSQNRGSELKLSLY